MRRRRAIKRARIADSKYNNKLIGEFISAVMLQGKRSKAEKIMYDALDIIGKKTDEKDVLKVFTKALENAKPLLQVKSRRVGGATYQVPLEVKHDRGMSLAMRWVRDFARTRKGKPMAEKLADELLDAYKGTGSSIKKRDDTHKMAEANKAFSHYRW